MAKVKRAASSSRRHGEEKSHYGARFRTPLEMNRSSSAMFCAVHHAWLDLEMECLQEKAPRQMTRSKFMPVQKNGHSADVS
jgi:hypothetical protein